VRDKYNASNATVDSLSADVSDIEKAALSKEAMLANKIQRLQYLTTQIAHLEGPNGCLAVVRKAIEEIHDANAASHAEEHLTADESAPTEILSYLDQRLHDLQEANLTVDMDMHAVVKQLTKSFKKLVRIFRLCTFNRILVVTKTDCSLFP
jgi:hypothetical protein